MVVQVVNGDVKEPRPQQRKGDVELSGTVRNRFVEGRACAGGDGVRLGLDLAVELRLVDADGGGLEVRIDIPFRTEAASG